MAVAVEAMAAEAEATVAAKAASEEAIKELPSFDRA
jgi:hypothetical protein